MFSNAEAAQVQARVYNDDALVTLPSDSFSVGLSGQSGQSSTEISSKSIRAQMSPCSPMVQHLAKRVRAGTPHFEGGPGLLNNRPLGYPGSPQGRLLNGSQSPAGPHLGQFQLSPGGFAGLNHQSIMTMLGQEDGNSGSHQNNNNNNSSLSAPPSQYVSAAAPLHSPMYVTTAQTSGDRRSFEYYTGGGGAGPQIIMAPTYNSTIQDRINTIENNMTSMKLEQDVDDAQLGCNSLYNMGSGSGIMQNTLFQPDMMLGTLPPIPMLPVNALIPLQDHGFDKQQEEESKATHFAPGFYDDEDNSQNASFYEAPEKRPSKGKFGRGSQPIEITPEVSKIISQTLNPIKKGSVATQDPLLCTQCNRSFSSFTTYKKHSRTHSAERIFPCPQCSLQFSERANLKRHIRHMHLGERDFECPIESCKTKFSRKSHLVHHLSGKKHYTDEVKASCTEDLWQCVQAEITKRKRK